MGWDQLSLADRTMFPARDVAVVVEYKNGAPQKPALVAAPPAAAPRPGPPALSR